MSTLITSASIFRSIEPVVAKFWGLGYDEFESEFDKIAKVEDVDEPILDHTEFGGPGTLSYKGEGEAIVGGRLIQGVSKRFQASTFAGALEISREAVADTKYRAITKAAESFGRSAKLTPEYLWAQFMDRAFNSSFPAIGDNKELCSTTHTTPKGSTYSNMLSPAAALNEASLEQVYINLMTIAGSDDLLAPLMPYQLIVPPALVPQAFKLTTSHYQVGSANNNPSYVYGMAEPQVDHFLSSATRWFVSTNVTKEGNGLFWHWRERPEYIRDNVSLQLLALFVAFFRAYWGCIDGRGIYGINAS